jgi:translation initiation factor IF-3
LIGPAGEQEGVIDTRDALQRAKDLGLDLLEVSPNADPPVCRIMDYGKYKYQKKKKLQEAKKHQSVIQIKEIQLSPNTDDHDIHYKVGHIVRFLKEGNKAKVSVRFRGREMTHLELGKNMLNKVAAELVDVAVIDQDAKIEGRRMSMIFSAKN